MTRFEKLKAAIIEETADEIADLLPPFSCEFCWLRDTCERNENCAKAVKKYLEEEVE